MIHFMVFAVIIVVQRLVELFIAKRNEAWMKSQGAIEFGSSHYPYIVVMHLLFLICFMIEVMWLQKKPSDFWPILLGVFIVVQAGRVWALASLGRYWNTKIIVLPNAHPVKCGPYRYIKHPNYLIVAIELLVIPLMFNAFFTAIIFSLLNIVVLSIRIPAEERALAQLTEYKSDYGPVEGIILNNEK
jgi:methyltransferase